MKKKTFGDEIDIYDLIYDLVINLWNNKYKILIITTAFIILGYINYYNSSQNYITTTNIKSISTFESQKYELYNNLSEEVFLSSADSVQESDKDLDKDEDKDLDKDEDKDSVKKTSSSSERNIIAIDSEVLLNLFISKIQTVKIIEEGIIKFKLINKNNFNNEEDYNEAVKQYALSIIDQMTSPYKDRKDKRQDIPYWQYKFKVNDKLSWKNFLQYIERQANEETRKSLISRFNMNLEILSNSAKFILEDIDQDIANEFDDYKTFISNRLEFLKEQAEIARALNIAGYTLEAVSSQTDYTIVTNIKSESSYYLKGYEMIEKEISLINSRKNDKFFIPELIELESSKRSIIQDKRTERLKFLFSKTPIANKNEFIAARIDYVSTVYEPEVSFSKTMIVSFMTGLLISFIYLFFNNVIASRR